MLTIVGDIQKGEEVEISLDLNQLLAHSKVSADSYFSQQSNWQKVFLNYASVPGLQKEVLTFKNVDFGRDSSSDFGVFSNARDSFFIKSLIIVDKQGGVLQLSRGDLTVADFDIHMGSEPLEFTGFTAIGINDQEVNVIDDIQSDIISLQNQINSINQSSSVDSNLVDGIEITNNQSVFVNITDAVLPDNTRTAILHYSVERSNSVDNFVQIGELKITSDGSSFFINDTFSGDFAGVDFNITSSGQIQYKSSYMASISYQSKMYIKIVSTFQA